MVPTQVLRTAVLALLLPPLSCRGREAPSQQTSSSPSGSAPERLADDTSISRALARDVPGFERWTCPGYQPGPRDPYLAGPQGGCFAVVDLNGDGRPDVVLTGQEPTRWSIVALLSADSGYRAVHLMMRDFLPGVDVPRPDWVVSAAPAGFDGAPTAGVWIEGRHFGFAHYIWDGKNFVEWVTGE